MSTLAVRPHNSTSGGVKNVECRIAQPPKEGRGLDLEQEEKVIRIADELDKAPRHNHRGQDPVLLSLHNVGRDDVSEQDAREELHDSAEDVGSNEAERSVENLLPYGEETGMQTGAPGPLAYLHASERLDNHQGVADGGPQVRIDAALQEVVHSEEEHIAP